MPSKDFVLDEHLTVTVYKRKGNRNLRLSISSTGQVRVSIPAWAPYGAGLNFAKTRSDWIRSQQTVPRLLKPGQAIGKAHHLQFLCKANATKVTSQVKGSLINVSYPQLLTPAHKTVQNAAHKACIRALRSQAEQLLPQRLSTLAVNHGFTYKSVQVNHLKSLWGSCDQDKNLVLNLFLMQLPWELIDYVLLHELTHTTIHRHGPAFWQALAAKRPEAASQRRALHNYQPVLL